MKELTIEEKAEIYNKVREKIALRFGSNVAEEIFSEFEMSKDEKIRKELLSFCQNRADNYPNDPKYANISNWIAWLEKQGEPFDDNIITREDEILQAISIGLTDAKEDLGWSDFGGLPIEEIQDWLEKQGEQEQLYIRFGEIPTDGKSKIFQGEIEVGTENGVSVYPAFKTSEGDIVLGLSLPITKTTLYTQQHLIEYDDRPCYLVKGDYVGKDTDGQPLINNVSIIEKIDTYRVKEEKQSEQKPTDKVEPKFHEGEWIISNDKKSTYQVIEVKRGIYVIRDNVDNHEYHIGIEECEKSGRLFTIQDAKDGDVLVASDSSIFIFKEVRGSSCKHYIALTSDNEIQINTKLDKFWETARGVKPSTKEQRDTLLKAMADAGYTFDFGKKELKKIEKKSQRMVSAEAKEALYDEPTDEEMKELLRTEYEKGRADTINEMKSSWSEEDESNFQCVLLRINDNPLLEDVNVENYKCWLKSLKQRIIG